MIKVLILVLLLVVFGAGIAFISEKETAIERVGNTEADTENVETEQLIADGTPARVDETRILDLSGQGLSKTPSYVFNRTDITELDISNNSLEGALPAEVRHLQNLKVLNLSNNNFTGVPAEVGQLQNLETLNLSNNQLTGLPYELGNLYNLRVLDLRGNDFSQQDLEVIKGKLPDTVVIQVD